MSKFTSPADEAFFGAIGRLTISWGHLDFGLDCLVEIVYLGCNGHEIEAEIPRSLSRKLRYLRAAFKRMPLQQDAIEAFLLIFDQIETEARFRHNLIHGIITEQTERSGEAVITRVVREKHGVTKGHFRITTAEILQAAKRTVKLGTRVFSVVDKVYRLVPKSTSQVWRKLEYNIIDLLQSDISP